jgi:hypothetical protein
MSDSSEQFLTAETAATKVLADLERLKSEVEGYAEARVQLDVAGRRLEALVSETESLAIATVENVRTLNQMGMPEILDRLKDIGEAVESLRHVQTDLQEHFSATSDGLTKSLRTTTIIAIAAVVAAMAAAVVSLPIVQAALGQ